MPNQDIKHKGVEEGLVGFSATQMRTHVNAASDHCTHMDKLKLPTQTEPECTCTPTHISKYKDAIALLNKHEHWEMTRSDAGPDGLQHFT